MFKCSREMVKEALDSFGKMDNERAKKVLTMDDQVDAFKKKINNQ